MIHRTSIIKAGMTDYEAQKIIKVLDRSPLNAVPIYHEGSKTMMPIKSFHEAQAIEFLKTKTHLEYVGRFLENIGE